MPKRITITGADAYICHRALISHIAEAERQIAFCDANDAADRAAGREPDILANTARSIWTQDLEKARALVATLRAHLGLS